VLAVADVGNRSVLGLILRQQDVRRVMKRKTQATQMLMARARGAAEVPAQLVRSFSLYVL